MLAVIGIHACMTARGFTAPRAVSVLDDKLHFAVPLLVFLSGVLIWGRPPDLRPHAYRRFMSRRLARVGLPYLAWFAFYAALSWLMPPAAPGLGQGVAPGAGTAFQLFLRLFSGSVWYHLYFIPMILSFAALTPVAVRALRSHRFAPEMLLALTLVVKALLFPLLSAGIRAAFGQDIWAYLTHIFVHLPHMTLGAWFAIRLSPLLSSEHDTVQGAAIGTNLHLRATRLSTWLSVLRYPVLIVALAVLARRLEPLWQCIQKPLTKLAALSFGAYFLHPFFLLCLQLLLLPVSTAGPPASTPWIKLPFILGVWLLLTVVSFAAAAVLARFRPTRWLIGE